MAVIAPVTLPNLETVDIDRLRALLKDTHEQLVATHEQLTARDQEIELLQLMIAKLRRMQFGRKSEKLDQQIHQLQLWLDELATEQEEQNRPPDLEATPEAESKSADNHHGTDSSQSAKTSPVSKHGRRKLPAHLPREKQVHAPECTSCSECGKPLTKIGDDVSEVLEFVPSYFKVIEHIRPKMSCTFCETIVQEPAPSRPIERGLAGPALLAHVVVSKYADHLPLYRQAEIYARAGVDLDRSTLADWIGATSHLLEPLVDTVHDYVFSGVKLHVDETPVPVLSPGTGKTKKGRLWAYVRDDRPAGDSSAPAVWFAYSADRKGEHPQEHLRDFQGILQADAYAGFQSLYQSGLIVEAGCWAHSRRHLYDMVEAHGSPLAREAIERIGAFYAIEQDIRGRPPKERLAVRQARTLPLLQSFQQWLEEHLTKLSRKSQMAKAMRYILTRWDALTRFCQDGRIEMDNNAAYAASGINKRIPRCGLCRVRAGNSSWDRRISDFSDGAGRHNQRLSRNASKGSAGRKRFGIRPDGLA